MFLFCRWRVGCGIPSTQSKAHGEGCLEYHIQAPNRRHTGRGFGALASFVGRNVLPFLKRVLLPKAGRIIKKHVLPAVGRSVRDGVGDMLQGKNFKATAKKRALEAGERVFENLTRNGKRGNRNKRRKKRATTRDIFD